MLLSAITVSPDVQLHARPLDNDTVAAYVEAMAAGAVFPPLTVFDDGEEQWLAGGFHRLAAMRFLSVVETEAVIHTGGKSEAMVFAATDNITHGRPMTRAQRQEAGERLIRLTPWSDREIARQLAIANVTVSEWRHNLSVRKLTDNPSGENPTGAPREIVVHRAQSTYTMRTPAKTLLEVVEDEPEEDELEERSCYGSCVHAIVHSNEQDSFTCAKSGRLSYMDSAYPDPFTCPDYATEWQTPAPVMPFVAHNTGENEWYTPPEYIAAARRVMGVIDLDPASSVKANETVGAPTFYTKEQDGLGQSWAGRVWMNPPYAGELIGKFAAKFAIHVANGEITEGIVLVNNATETRWFAELVGVCKAVVFTTSRIRFLDENGLPGAPLQGQAILYAGDRWEIFVNEFSIFGWAARIQ